MGWETLYVEFFCYLYFIISVIGTCNMQQDIFIFSMVFTLAPCLNYIERDTGCPLWFRTTFF